MRSQTYCQVRVKGAKRKLDQLGLCHIDTLPDRRSVEVFADNLLLHSSLLIEGNRHSGGRVQTKQVLSLVGVMVIRG